MKTLPQTIDVIRTRAGYFGFEVVLGKGLKIADAGQHEVLRRAAAIPQ